MIRLAALVILALAALLTTRADAQPELPGTFQAVDAKADNGKFIWTEMRAVPVEKTVEVQVMVDGRVVKQARKILVYEYVSVTKEVELKKLKATDGAGKGIAADKLAELLKETTPVVLVSGSVPEKHRKLFKDTTVFVELPKIETAPPADLPPKK